MSVVERFKTVVPIDNPSKNEGKIRDFISTTLSGIGLKDQSVDAAGNLFVRIPGKDGAETLMLSAHMDSVPPCEGIVPVEDTRESRPIIRSEGKTILGADDKSGIAVILELMEDLSKEGFQNNHPLELFLSTEEEIGLNGAKGFDTSQCKSKKCYVLDGEGRVGMIFNAGPTQERVEVNFTGLAAHAGIAPEAGINAIIMAADFCSSVPGGRISDKLTSNIGLIDGGKGINVIAPNCSVTGDIRSHDETQYQELLTTMKTEASRIDTIYDKASVDFTHIRKYDGFFVEESHPMIEAVITHCRDMDIMPMISPMNIGSDAHILNKRGIATVVLGMGFHYSHSLGEFIFTEELEQVYDLTKRLVSI